MILSLIRSTAIKLSLPINVILDASLFARSLLSEPEPCDPTLLISASLYLSAKINEQDGRVRVRDILNTALYTIKEYWYIQNVL